MKTKEQKLIAKLNGYFKKAKEADETLDKEVVELDGTTIGDLRKKFSVEESGLKINQRILDIANEVALNRNEILEHFAKAYLAHHSKETPIGELMDKIELVQDHSESGLIKFYFRLKD